ncbi:hypothetical protein pah_c022o147 [Parachlamydia acanthamoebae str. Hall's coccus]|nr:hypothetical protein pah_c022o147 [Parachlamydia acanthamoebae str. Hall's coccus]
MLDELEYKILLYFRTENHFFNQQKKLGSEKPLTYMLRKLFKSSISGSLFF